MINLSGSELPFIIGYDAVRVNSFVSDHRTGSLGDIWNGL